MKNSASCKTRQAQSDHLWLQLLNVSYFFYTAFLHSIQIYAEYFTIVCLKMKKQIRNTQKFIFTLKFIKKNKTHTIISFYATF